MFARALSSRAVGLFASGSVQMSAEKTKPNATLFRETLVLRRHGTVATGRYRQVILLPARACPCPSCSCWGPPLQPSTPGTVLCEELLAGGSRGDPAAATPHAKPARTPTCIGQVFVWHCSSQSRVWCAQVASPGVALRPQQPAALRLQVSADCRPLVAGVLCDWVSH